MPTVREILIGHSQHGWQCELTFTVRTARQFTDEWHTVNKGSRWFVVSVAKSWLAMRRYIHANSAKAGERKAKGWV